MLRKVLIIAVMVMALLFGCTTRDELSSASALDFSLQDLNGKTVKLSDFKGKPVLIDFWATWCQPCRDSIPIIVKLHRTFSSKGLVVLGISLDEGGWNSVKSFAASQGITYPVLIGSHDAVEKFQIRTIPTLVVINKNGEIVKRYLGVGDESGLEKDIKAIL